MEPSFKRPSKEAVDLAMRCAAWYKNGMGKGPKPSEIEHKFGNTYPGQKILEMEETETIPHAISSCRTREMAWGFHTKTELPDLSGKTVVVVAGDMVAETLDKLRAAGASVITAQQPPCAPRTPVSSDAVVESKRFLITAGNDRDKYVKDLAAVKPPNIQGNEPWRKSGFRFKHQRNSK